MFGAGENDVQPFLAAVLVDQTEIHQHPPAGIVTVADAHDTQGVILFISESQTR
jgi:hypothetical protein